MGRPPKYNWDGLFKRAHTVLVRGIDYQCSQSSMAGSIRNKASKLGLRVKLADTGDSIIIKVIGAIPHTNQAAVTSESQPPALA